MTTRFHCPLRSCGEWTYDVVVEMVDGILLADPAAAFERHVLATEKVIRDHMESHPLEEWVREVSELRAALDDHRA